MRLLAFWMAGTDAHHKVLNNEVPVHPTSQVHKVKGKHKRDLTPFPSGKRGRPIKMHKVGG